MWTLNRALHFTSWSISTNTLSTEFKWNQKQKWKIGTCEFLKFERLLCRRGQTFRKPHRLQGVLCEYVSWSYRGNYFTPYIQLDTPLLCKLSINFQSTSWTWRCERHFVPKLREATQFYKSDMPRLVSWRCIATHTFIYAVSYEVLM